MGEPILKTNVWIPVYRIQTTVIWPHCWKGLLEKYKAALITSEESYDASENIDIISLSY